MILQRCERSQETRRIIFFSRKGLDQRVLNSKSMSIVVATHCIDILFRRIIVRSVFNFERCAGKAIVES